MDIARRVAIQAMAIARKWERWGSLKEYSISLVRGSTEPQKGRVRLPVGPPRGQSGRGRAPRAPIADAFLGLASGAELPLRLIELVARALELLRQVLEAHRGRRGHLRCAPCGLKQIFRWRVRVIGGKGGTTNQEPCSTMSPAP